MSFAVGAARANRRRDCSQMMRDQMSGGHELESGEGKVAEAFMIGGQQMLFVLKRDRRGRFGSSL